MNNVRGTVMTLEEEFSKYYEGCFVQSSDQHDDSIYIARSLILTNDGRVLVGCDNANRDSHTNWAYTSLKKIECTVDMFSGQLTVGVHR